jgi:predicted secreted protein
MTLLRGQGDDGSWAPGTDQAAPKTAHALLFLAAARR